jgi:hypothetical protein
MNKTDDKRSNAMAMLKARREGKQKRGNIFGCYNKCQLKKTLCSNCRRRRSQEGSTTEIRRRKRGNRWNWWKIDRQIEGI